MYIILSGFSISRARHIRINFIAPMSEPLTSKDLMVLTETSDLRETLSLTSLLPILSPLFFFLFPPMVAFPFFYLLQKNASAIADALQNISLALLRSDILHALTAGKTPRLTLLPTIAYRKCLPNINLIASIFYHKRLHL